MPDHHFCRQSGLALLRASGRDARRFLHAQTTQRIDDMQPTETRLAAWLNARGRVLALFDVVPDGEEFLLLLPVSNLTATGTGLRRYVLRDDVRIEPAAERAIFTVTGDIDDWLATRGLDLPLSRAATAGGAILARTGTGRVDVIAPAGALPPLLAGLPETDADAAALAAIADGRPEVPATLADRYTPHMLGLERDAVSFTKGCYPGQEIVARTEHRGEVKRRVRRFACEAGPRPAAGDGIADAAGAGAGEVNRAAPAGDGFELLAVVGIEPGNLPLRLADGRTLRPLAI